jgi:glycosyltransferase involved in cell wall biosynthesis
VTDRSVNPAESGGDDRPTVALIAVGPLPADNPVTSVIREGHRRFRFVAICRGLPTDLDGLAELRHVGVVPGSFKTRWASFYAGATLRLRGVRADLVHMLGPAPLALSRRLDIVTPMFCWAAFYEALAGERLRGPSLAWAAERRFALGLERRTFVPDRVGVLAAESAGLAGDLERHYPAIPVELTVRGTDLERFHPDPGARARMRADQGVRDGDPVALLVARGRGELKGIGVAIAALAELKRAGRPTPLLWIVGHGQRGYRAHAERLGVADRVSLLGSRAEMREVFSAADIFLLPSVYETFSMAAHEAAACGLPLIATPVNGVRELIGEGEAGILVERDAASVAAALDRLAGDAELRARLGAVGRQRASGRRFDAYSKSVLALYERLIASQPGGRAGRIATPDVEEVPGRVGGLGDGQ